MKFWDNLQTAFNLADRVEEVEKELAEVKFEWGEIEEKLLAREERLRKRLSRELKKELDSPVAPVPEPFVPLEGATRDKVAIMRAFRSQKEG